MSTRIILALLLVLGLSACEDKKRSLAVSKIKEVSKLATTRTELSKFIFANQQKRFLGIFRLNDSRFAAKTKAYVLAGIDLGKINDYDIRTSGNRISIELPPVEVLDFAYPFSEYQIDYSLTTKSFANTISVERHEELFRMAESQIREMLPYLGIKEATETKTRQLMESLLRGLGYTEIYVSFRHGKDENAFIQQIPLTDDELR
ncbi:MAG TPA: DUF4230 domain-containing protein [Cyclobacteriaceae bacterium]|nr:DUF4230 domain-containing protein [Cyclobacteriaceae bacterium]